MPTATKETIAEAAKKLMFEKKAKKLTVKDIVEECGITRQTFYYHFEDIPDMLSWIVECDMTKNMKEMLDRRDVEGSIRYFFLMAINAKPYVDRTINSNYGEELKRLMYEQLSRFFTEVVHAKNFFPGCSADEIEFIVRYHTGAIMGLLHNWTPSDTAKLDIIVSRVNKLLNGQITSHMNNSKLKMPE